MQRREVGVVSPASAEKEAEQPARALAASTADSSSAGGVAAPPSVTGSAACSSRAAAGAQSVGKQIAAKKLVGHWRGCELVLAIKSTGGRRYDLWRAAKKWRKGRRTSLGWLVATGRCRGIVLAPLPGEGTDDGESGESGCATRASGSQSYSS